MRRREIASSGETELNYKRKEVGDERPIKGRSGESRSLR